MNIISKGVIFFTIGYVCLIISNAFLEKTRLQNLLYEQNKQIIELNFKIAELSSNKIKEVKPEVKPIKVKEDNPLLINTFSELKKFVNETYNSKEIIIYTATIDYSRKINLFIKILKELKEPHPIDYAHLLVVTEQIETNGGATTKQKNGSALSTFQIEPMTYNDMIKRVISKNENIKTVLNKYKHDKHNLFELEYNYIYSMIIAYTVYKSKLKETPPPDKNDLVKQTEIHKKYYNTIKGKSSVSNSLKKTIGIL